MVAKGWNIDVDTSPPVTNPQVLLVGIYYWNLAHAPLLSLESRVLVFSPLYLGQSS